ncbi:FAD-dependent oxidoreductase [Halomonas sp. McH1-25]|uniref:NAD(P)/FAD-dependent oxidoreductase n=1 Tax=unclassified Halomonas TaxID=2609666 RepID=UPI001EF5553A|nr:MULTISPECIES: NAD(P)/FAD-dependent oxidoreductase [unclassified Halomonas]MCG7601132.1 FAD-dependent oxidoreductase [Halomonas sp. McH1-25]MCP1344581.1 FAD-dependent oxidoreductase [Halomonas sp. FL8]MCP1362595.1 FAD-dependent oxidoreductase [Halomonas sp. BBD45]MCP1363975.1 FAD-dependent oxidoreductase [Halomonas sp. BBD48]
MITHDLVILGSGPAGMAAAMTAAQHGLSPIVIDEQPAPGGQVYRAIETTPVNDRRVLGQDYWSGETLAKGLHHQNIDYQPNTSVWQLTRQRDIGLLHHEAASMIRARRVILATGAMERPFPIPGWTLPGVMTAGSAQILLKSSGVVPNAPAVMAGSGPLLFLLAAQYLRAGVPIAALLDTTPRGRYRKALPYLPAAVRNIPTLTKGLGLLQELRRAGVRHIKYVSALRAEGDNQLERIRWQTDGQDTWESLETSTLLLHQGVVPNTQITRALHCEHDWNEQQLAWHPRLDEWLMTDVEGIAVAGDGGGIVGAQAAAIQGQLAGLGAAIALGKVKSDEGNRQAAQLRQKLARETSIRPFLDVMYQPALQWRLPSDDTLVCRCEEVTAGEIRRIARMGCRGPNQTKSFSRCGMGPCQGRMCGLTVSELLADANQQSVEATGYYRLRPPFKPITLGQLARAAEDNQ